MTNAKVNILPERLWKQLGSNLYFGVNCSRRWVFCISSIEYWQTPLYGHSLNKAPHYYGYSALTLFEITGDPRSLIGSQQCDLFTNHTIALNHICSKSRHSCLKSHHFCFKSHHFCAIPYHFCFEYSSFSLSRNKPGTKKKIRNRPVEEAKKMKGYKRLIYKQFVQISGLCGPQFLSY